MRDGKKVMNDFMERLRNMEKYQGISLLKPETYDFNREIVHKTYSLEKKIVYTQEESNQKLLEAREKDKR